MTRQQITYAVNPPVGQYGPRGSRYGRKDRARPFDDRKRHHGGSRSRSSALYRVMTRPPRNPRRAYDADGNQIPPMHFVCVPNEVPGS